MGRRGRGAEERGRGGAEGQGSTSVPSEGDESPTTNFFNGVPVIQIIDSCPKIPSWPLARLSISFEMVWRFTGLERTNEVVGIP